MEFPYLITFNDNPVCLCSKMNIVDKLKEFSMLRHHSEYTIHIINSIGDIYTSSRVKILYEKKTFKYFIDNTLFGDESSFKSMLFDI
jgi:hypothetical protein